MILTLPLLSLPLLTDRGRKERHFQLTTEGIKLARFAVRPGQVQKADRTAGGTREAHHREDRFTAKDLQGKARGDA